MKKLIIPLVAALALCGCATIADHLAAAIEPQLERLVDAQIEREERMAGIWGTTNSYFYAASAEAKAQEEAKKEEVLSAVVELIAKNQDTLLKQAEKLVEKKLKGGD